MGSARSSFETKRGMLTLSMIVSFARVHEAALFIQEIIEATFGDGSLGEPKIPTIYVVPFKIEEGSYRIIFSKLPVNEFEARRNLFDEYTARALHRSELAPSLVSATLESEKVVIVVPATTNGLMNKAVQQAVVRVMQQAGIRAYDAGINALSVVFLRANLEDFLKEDPSLIVPAERLVSG